MKAIQIMNILSKDLNLLPVFQALNEERNVSRAAKRLHLSQPALSHALQRLREMFDDELFVRVARGVAPTPKALALAEPVDQMLTQARELWLGVDDFNPKNASGRLVIAATDFLEQIFAVELIAKVRREAPNVQILFRNTVGILPKAEMEKGQIDLAIAGFFGEVPEGFQEQQLMQYPYATVARAKHPEIAGSTLSLEQFLKAEHILVSLQGDFNGVIDRELAAKKLQRRVVLGVSSFMATLEIVSRSDLIATIPKMMADRQAKRFGLNVFAPPVKVAPIQMMQVWHTRTTRDPLRVWLRKVVADVASSNN